MSMVRCDANKHFYDTNVHTNCPYCNIGTFETTPIVDFGDKTEILNGHHNGIKTDPSLQDMGASTVRVYENDPTVMLEQSPKQQEIQAMPFLNENITPSTPHRSPNKTQILGFGLASENQPNQHVDSSMNLGKLPVTGWLVVIEGPGIGLDFRLIQGENRIGRDKDMEVCLDFGDISDDMISRDSHAIVVYDNHANVFFVERGRSRNMPMLNNRTIRSGEDLKAGDIIQVGKTKLMLVSFCNESFKWS